MTNDLPPRLSAEQKDEIASWLYTTGRDLAEQGELHAACLTLLASVQLSPHYKAYEVLGRLLLSQGLVELAAPFLAFAAVLNDGFQPSYLMAQALLQLGIPEKARDCAQRAVRSQPHSRRGRELLDDVEESLRRLSQEGK